MAATATLTLDADTPDGIAAVNRLADAIERLNVTMSNPRPPRIPWAVAQLRALSRDVAGEQAA
jgi:hypothetical protein